LSAFLFLVLVGPANADGPHVFLDRPIVPADAPEVSMADLPKMTQIRLTSSLGWSWLAASNLCVEPWYHRAEIEGEVEIRYTMSVDIDGLAAFAFTDDGLPDDVRSCIGEVVLAIPTHSLKEGVMKEADLQKFKYDAPFGEGSQDKTVVTTQKAPPGLPGPSPAPRTLEDYVNNARSTLAALPE